MAYKGTVAGGNTIKISIKNLPQIKAAFRKAPDIMTEELSAAIRKTVMYIRGRAVSNAPVKTGRLRASAYTNFKPLSGEIGFNASYAAAVHDGSKAHIIRARGSGFLYWKGAGHPVKQVNHPGYRGNPFLKRAVEQSEVMTDKFMTEAVQNALDKIGKMT
jgi:hypothetical protein